MDMHKIPFLIILLIGISLIPFSFSEGIPEWVKNNASWWSERQISQTEFTNGLEFLINEGIIYIPQTEPGPSGPDKIIPDWVRNTAGWWADDKIPDSEFVNAMKYLIEIGLIEVDASSPEIIKEETVEEIIETNPVTGKPLLMLLEGYNHVSTDGKYVLDVLIFDADKYPNASPNFNRNAAYTIDGVRIDVTLYNEEGQIHTYDGLTKNGFFRYDVLARETNQDGTLWMINNLYTVNIKASLDGQTVEKQIEFLGQASAYAYNSGSAIRSPSGLTATAGNDLVKLSWTAPSGVKGISDYTIQYSTDQNTWTTFTEASVSDIRAADAETDGSNSFTELAGASGVDTFTIDGTSYAIVTGNSDNGVQIIDISDPTNIVAKDAQDDGDAGGFDELEGVREVKTFKVPDDTNTYAIAVSPTDDGVQILNITDPTAITATDDETDGENSFTELKGAIAVDIFTIGGGTYAIVAAQSDDGVQIIDISDPTNIVAKDAQDDGDSGGFDRLDGPRDVKVFTVSGDSNTYAIVTSLAEHAVQILNITDPTAITATDSEVDGANSFTELEDAFGVDVFTIDSSTYAIVTGFLDDGVQIIDISDPTDIVAKDAETDGANSFTELDGAQGVDVFTIGSNTYAAVVSKVDDGVQILNITDPTAITATDAQDDGDSGGFDELNGAREVKAFEINSQVYAIITADTDSGIQMISLDGDGSTTSVVVDGLDNETLYYFRVAGENYSGLGKYSSVVSATTT